MKLFVCLFCLLAEDILEAYNVWKARGNYPPDADKKVTLVFVCCLLAIFRRLYKTLSLDFAGEAHVFVLQETQ